MVYKSFRIWDRYDLRFPSDTFSLILTISEIETDLMCNFKVAHFVYMWHNLRRTRNRITILHTLFVFGSFIILRQTWCVISMWHILIVFLYSFKIELCLDVWFQRNTSPVSCFCELQFESSFMRALFRGR